MEIAQNGVEVACKIWSSWCLSLSICTPLAALPLTPVTHLPWSQFEDIQIPHKPHLVSAALSRPPLTMLSPTF